MATSRAVLIFDCSLKLTLCYFECVAASNTKKKTSEHFLCETGTTKYVAHVLERAVSKRYISLPRTEITDTLQRHSFGPNFSPRKHESFVMKYVLCS